MKQFLKILFFALLAFGLFACGGNGKKLTLEDMRAAQDVLFNPDGTLNKKEAPKVVKKYCRYTDQNPNDTSAAIWLYHAIEVNIMMKNADKSVELCDQLLQQYPQTDWAPMSLLLMGSYVYEKMLNDTAQAHAAYQKVIDNYPGSEYEGEAQRFIEYLGLTQEERNSRIIMSQMEEEEASEL